MDRVITEEFLRALRNSLALGITNMSEALDDEPFEFLRSKKGN